MQQEIINNEKNRPPALFFIEIRTRKMCLFFTWPQAQFTNSYNLNSNHGNITMKIAFSFFLIPNAFYLNFVVFLSTFLSSFVPLNCSCIHNCQPVSSCSGICKKMDDYSNSGYFNAPPPPGGGLLPYMGYIGMCGPKGYGFSAVLVINRVSNLADCDHKQGIVFVLQP